MKTLKSIVIGLVLGYNALGCGPDSVNNYYGAGKGGSGTSGNFGSYTCDDYGEAYVSCVHPSDSPSYSDHVSEIIEKCAKMGYSSECIDCVVNGPCEFDSTKYVPHNPNEDPLIYCRSKGICPESY